MIVFTDSRDFGSSLLPQIQWRSQGLSGLNLGEGSRFLADRMLAPQAIHFSREHSLEAWDLAFLVEHSPFSQFDLLIEACGQQFRFPDKIFCAAGSGQGFHGQRGRPWSAVRGNLHLSVMFRPHKTIPRFHVAFPLLAAVSVLETLDGLVELKCRAGVKWVNDILLEGAKVAGFVTHTQSQEQEVKSVVLGIGLNVATSPSVPPDDFVPRVASLAHFLPGSETCSLNQVLPVLLDNLDRNYRLVLEGKIAPLLDFYRERSLVLGRNIRVMSDPISGDPQEFASGRVLDIGENLELYIDNRSAPVTQGRLILEE